MTLIDGAHCKAGCDPDGIEERYSELVGVEVTFENEPLAFRCKQLA